MTTRIPWRGVMPAITTALNQDLSVDHAWVADHVRWLVDHGCTAIVPHGSLGEGASLSIEEKVSLQKTCVEAVGLRVPVIPGIAALSTREAVQMAQRAAEVGCQGLMVLPPYAYSTDWREMKAHVSAVFRATALPCMLYNNPIAYQTDFLPEQIRELADEHQNFESVKESSTDVRRVTAIRAACGDRLTIGVGVDDCVVEGIAAGAEFWVAGLVNALPAESVALFNLATQGADNEAHALYRWFLPLLWLDTVPKFVQYIKCAQAAVGRGSTRVRPPRLELTGDEKARITRLIENALAGRPGVESQLTEIDV